MKPVTPKTVVRAMTPQGLNVKASPIVVQSPLRARGHLQQIAKRKGEAQTKGVITSIAESVRILSGVELINEFLKPHGPSFGAFSKEGEGVSIRIVSPRQQAALAKAQEARRLAVIKRKDAQIARMQGRAKGQTIKNINMGKNAVKSSNVSSVNYDELNQVLYVEFHNGTLYAYDLTQHGGFDTALKVYFGDATAKTDDPTIKRRWWRGKNPSVGAAVWKYLRRKSVPYRLVGKIRAGGDYGRKEDRIQGAWSGETTTASAGLP